MIDLFYAVPILGIVIWIAFGIYNDDGWMGILSVLTILGLFAWVVMGVAHFANAAVYIEGIGVTERVELNMDAKTNLIVECWKYPLRVETWCSQYSTCCEWIEPASGEQIEALEQVELMQGVYQ